MNTKNYIKKVACLLSLVMVFTMLFSGNTTVSAATKASLSFTKKTVVVTDTVTIGIKNKVKGATYSFSTGSKKIATVSSKGVVKAVKTGNVYITVTQKLKGKKTKVGSAKITVVNPATLNEKTVSVAKGATVATPVTVNATKATMKYTSSDTAIATVADDGTITGVSVGTAKITVKAVYKSKTYTIGTVDVTVTQEPFVLAGAYEAYVDSYDNAPSVYKALVKLNNKVSKVDKADFKVSESRVEMDYTVFQMVEATADRDVTAAYTCDKNGKKVKYASCYVMLELRPSAAAKSILGSDESGNYNTWDTTYKLNIGLSDKSDITCKNKVVTSLDVDNEWTSIEFASAVTKFDTDSYKALAGTDKEVTYEYAYYSPTTTTDTLVVWLHGMGEGGSKNIDATDPSIILLAAEATALASKDFQEKIGGAYVVAPQCPTMWMDEGTGEIGGLGNSIYADSLDAFIDYYATKVGAHKIVVAGCSNGGYMTMVMALKNPTKYAAIIPLCEALQYQDTAEFKAKLDAVKNLPMYFSYADSDWLVTPDVYEVPTIKYLKSAGATNLQVSHFKTSYNTYAGEDTVYDAMGHGVWKNFFNNDKGDVTDGDIPSSTVAPWDWLASIVK